METEYDEVKDELNKSKHGVSLALGHVVIENRIGEVRDPRDYGEVRHIAFGLVAKRLYVCVYTMRNEAYRLISVRRANRREIQRWQS